MAISGVFAFVTGVNSQRTEYPRQHCAVIIIRGDAKKHRIIIHRESRTRQIFYATV